MLLSRYIAIVTFVVLFCLGILKENKNLSLKSKITKMGIVFTEGMVGGLIVDSIGINAGLYHFPRQPFMSFSYWAIVIPCWGVFGMFIDYCWNKLGSDKFVKGLLITTPILFAFYEGSNLLTGSWVYTSPGWSIVAGWPILVFALAGCHRRRTIRQRLQEAEEKAEDSGKKIVAGLYGFLGILQTIVMFPLMIASLVRLFTDLRKEDNKLEYAKYLLMIK